MLNLTGSKLERISQSQNKYLQNLKKEKPIETNEEINKILGDPYDENDTITNQNNQSLNTLTTIVTCQDGEQIEMPRSWTPESMVNNILSHNKINSVTNVMIVGVTGSGVFPSKEGKAKEKQQQQNESYMVYTRNTQAT